MNREQILQSSLLEKYVLGTTTPMEEGIVEQALSLFPDLKFELESLEKSLEQSAMSNKVLAPEGVKESILREISSQNISSSQVKNEGVSNIKSDSKIPFLSIAASFLVGALIAGLIGWNGINELEQTNDNLSNELALLKEDCQKEEQLFAFIQNVETQKLLLQSAEGHTSVGYWNENIKQGLFHSIDLPGIEESESYQIWADVEGEMLPIGLINQVDYVQNTFHELKYLEDAESINITIEPKGGSDHPNVSRLVFSAAI